MAPEAEEPEELPVPEVVAPEDCDGLIGLVGSLVGLLGGRARLGLGLLAPGLDRRGTLAAEDPVAGAAAAAVRSPTVMESKSMPVPLAAVSSCTSRLGMSSVDGMALPSRTTVA